jgi:DNA-binding HxlR family transcriptional regulator
VEYRITPLGRTLEEPFKALHIWTIVHLATVVKAQLDFDEREAEAE